MQYQKVLLDGDIVRTSEINLGTIPTYGGAFLVLDPDVSISTLLLVAQSGEAPTGKDQDENEMDALICVGVSGSGSFTVYITANPGPVVGNFKINYTIH